MKRWLLSIGLLLALSGVGLGANDGGTVSPFSFGAGARELSLGGASWTAPADAVAAFWNPARLARAERTAITGFYTRLFESDVAYQYAGVAVPTLDWGSFGIGVFRLGVDGIEQRDASNLLLGETSDNRMAIYLAYGRRLSGFDIGLAIQLEQHSLYSYSATSSPGLNLAAIRTVTTGSERVTRFDLAVQIRNAVKPEMKLDQQDISFPTQVAIGVSATILPNPSWEQEATVFAGVDKTNQVSSRLSLGMEYSFLNAVWLRGGLNDSKLAVGGGLSYRSISFDYSLVQRDMGSVHMFSLTSAFGAPASVRRETRARKQEQEFNQLMSDQLQKHNSEMIGDLIRQGKQMLGEGELTGAASAFDRALFLSRSGNMDTTAISALASECKQRLNDLLSGQRYSQAIDSAHARLALADYLGVRYYAGIALNERLNSAEAASLLTKANDAIQQSFLRDESISTRLWLADSLLSYGKTDEAQSVVSALAQFAPDDQGVQLAVKKVKFERFRQRAARDFAQENLVSALNAVDSALSLFAGHGYCLELRRQILAAQSIKGQPGQQVAVAKELPKSLSAEMTREVESDYETAQKHFKNGDLKQAIQYWEKVEVL